MSWLEQLPDQCPPEDVQSPNGFSCYRLVQKKPVEDSDFYSQRERFPEKTFSVSECRARSASVLTDLEEAKKVLAIMPKKEKFRIVRLHLGDGAGLVKHTPSRFRMKLRSHHSWWVKRDFHAHVKIEEQ